VGVGPDGIPVDRRCHDAAAHAGLDPSPRKALTPHCEHPPRAWYDRVQSYALRARTDGWRGGELATASVRAAAACGWVPEVSKHPLVLLTRSSSFAFLPRKCG
jgi:hypothetical protein